MGPQALLIILGVVANLFLGALTLYASRLADDIKAIEAVARTGAANAAILGRDVDNLSKWTTDEIKYAKQRLDRLEQRIK